MSGDTTEPEYRNPILVSWREFSKLKETIITIGAKLDQAVLQQAQLRDIEIRLVALETDRTVRNAKGGVYGKAWEIIFGLVLAIIAAGVWWPKH